MRRFREGLVGRPESLGQDPDAPGSPGTTLSVYCRQRFIVECLAAGVVAVDCPYTWSDIEGVEREARWARRLDRA
jgi:citrate lyase subunit beta/citryl-CoA lyase